MKYNLLFLLVLNFLYAKAQVTAKAGVDQLICLNDTLKVTGSGLNLGDTGSYQWKDLSNNQVISINANFSMKITSLTTRSFELLVTRFHNNVNYSSKDTFVLTVSPLPTFKFNALPPRCFDDGRINLTLNTIAIASQGNDTSKKFYDIRYYQKYKNPSWVTGGPVSKAPYFYDFPKFMTNAQIPASGLRDTICYDYKDNNGCYNYECKPIRLNPNPEVKVNEGVFCQKNGCISLDQLAIIPSNKIGGIQSWRCIGVPANSGVDPNTIIFVNNSSFPAMHCLDPGLPGEIKKTGDYLVEYCFKNPSTGCQRCDTSTVTVVRLPDIEFDAIPSQCINGSLLELDSFVKEKSTGKKLQGGSWMCVAYNDSRDLSQPNVKNAINNSVKNQKKFDPQINLNGGKYLLKYLDNNSGCQVSDSTIVFVNGLPQIILPAVDTICSNSGNYPLSSNYSSNDTNGKWTGTYVENGKFNSDLVNMNSFYTKSYSIKFSYTSPLTQCTNTDSQNIVVIKRPEFKFVQTVIKNTKFLVNFDLIDSNMNINQFKWSWNFGNGATSFDKYPREVLYMDSGNFKAFLTIDNGYCETKDSISFDLNNRTSELSSANFQQIHIYPNPVSKNLYIHSPLDITCILSDVNGKEILKREIVSGTIEPINLENYKSGFYLLTISNSDYIYRVKVIKE